MIAFLTMSVKKSRLDPPVSCCCQCRKNSDAGLEQVTAKLLYRIAFTIWHVAFHIENEQVGCGMEPANAGAVKG